MKRLWQAFDNFLDSYKVAASLDDSEKVNWMRLFPFVLLHVSCIAVFWVGWSPIAVIVAVAFYALRMFGITAFYHRYFSHKTFKTSRVMQFIFAMIGNASAQRGPLWWAAHHRHHHHHSDTDADLHSPNQGFFWSHMGWFMANKHYATQDKLIADFRKYKELVWLDRYDMVVPFACLVFMYGLGEFLATVAPQLGTNGLQMLVWGFLISTVVVIHATLCINSLAHVLGHRRFKTKDDSRNNFLLALITLGEGWHNNHHQFPNSARQGIRWWEIDISYYVLKGMEAIGLVWDVKPGPNSAQLSRALNK